MQKPEIPRDVIDRLKYYCEGRPLEAGHTPYVVLDEKLTAKQFQTIMQLLSEDNRLPDNFELDLYIKTMEPNIATVCEALSQRRQLPQNLKIALHLNSPKTESWGDRFTSIMELLQHQNLPINFKLNIKASITTPMTEVDFDYLRRGLYAGQLPPGFTLTLSYLYLDPLNPLHEETFVNLDSDVSPPKVGKKALQYLFGDPEKLALLPPRFELDMGSCEFRDPSNYAVLLALLEHCLSVTSIKLGHESIVTYSGGRHLYDMMPVATSTGIYRANPTCARDVKTLTDICERNKLLLPITERLYNLRRALHSEQIDPVLCSQWLTQASQLIDALPEKFAAAKRELSDQVVQQLSQEFHYYCVLFYFQVGELFKGIEYYQLLHSTASKEQLKKLQYHFAEALYRCEELPNTLKYPLALYYLRDPANYQRHFFNQNSLLEYQDKQILLRKIVSVLLNGQDMGKPQSSSTTLVSVSDDTQIISSAALKAELEMRIKQFDKHSNKFDYKTGKARPEPEPIKYLRVLNQQTDWTTFLCHCLTSSDLTDEFGPDVIVLESVLQAITETGIDQTRLITSARAKQAMQIWDDQQDSALQDTSNIDEFAQRDRLARQRLAQLQTSSILLPGIPHTTVEQAHEFRDFETTAIEQILAYQASHTLQLDYARLLVGIQTVAQQYQQSGSEFTQRAQYVNALAQVTEPNPEIAFHAINEPGVRAWLEQQLPEPGRLIDLSFNDWYDDMEFYAASLVAVLTDDELSAEDKAQQLLSMLPASEQTHQSELADSTKAAAAAIGASAAALESHAPLFKPAAQTQASRTPATPLIPIHHASS